MTDRLAEPAELPDIISYITLQETVQQKEVHMSTTVVCAQRMQVGLATRNFTISPMTA